VFPHDGRMTLALAILASIAALLGAATMVVLARRLRVQALVVDRLARQVGEDPLTGLANERTFVAACAAEFSRAERSGEPVSITALGLDHFKAINEAHGRAFGDELLCAVAETLRQAVRPHDTVARIGGVEFALLLPGAGSPEAFAVAERGRESIGRLTVGCERLSSSAGVATHPGIDTTPEQLQGLADRALSAAKAAGRGRTFVHESDLIGASPIEGLLAPGAIQCVFQPIVDMPGGELWGYEALSRFPGLDEPVCDVFARAHRIGMGVALELAAITAALRVGPPPEHAALTLNLSFAALCSDGVWDTLPGDLDNIIIEITEHEMIDDDDALMEAVTRLRARGAKIAIDDAGVGYGGLALLLTVHPDFIKLDRSIVHGVAGDRARGALIQAMTRFAQETGTRICVEGVEVATDLTYLIGLGVDLAQGYLMARPAPPWIGVNGGVVAQQQGGRTELAA
jgi:diguanylate cyclase (GGDEF)-like protein